MTAVWVLGSRGLLGSALSTTLLHDGVDVFAPQEPFSWRDESHLQSQVQAAVRAFSSEAQEAGGWEIYWAAGVGTMGSPEEVLTAETRAMTLFLEFFKSDASLMAVPGAIVFSSSAGAIYAASPEEIITEKTAVAPNNPYAYTKLKQEELLRVFAMECKNVSVLVARISTLYGVGQATGKSQGLLTNIARNIVRNRPTQIYVPLDTIRDYISAPDAAATIVGTLRMPERREKYLIKIIASERPTSIAEIVSIFKQISRRHPRITTSASRLSKLYSRRVQFRSVVPRGSATPTPESLIVGIAHLLSAERLAHSSPPSVSV
ncbi:NAD-dependent epimerase/dehydratase family protein [Variovorax saccharolyticus]|uniref:NAD-dependent epimerase/dehydratase family protein n=1 Tax=Variovorax saccharolyticus TaxID=3053516 RepID=UPI002577776B|nr:NAD-dependent epimerase/dehydratase family protein [Variovorax sp. J22R187]MDM0017555.1 NAD-dependent epimerase/dehydratase family protein [Variovorax sp. J22R187]